MPSELDRKYDQVLEKVVGPGGPVRIERDSMGRAIVANFPATLPAMFATFSALNGAREAVVAGNERLTFAELHDAASRLAHALAGSGIAKGDHVAIAMRNCPAWILVYMAALEAGAIVSLVNGWWQADELRHGLSLVEPKLVVCDAPRAARLAETGLGFDHVMLDVERPLAEALAPLFERGAPAGALPEIGPEDDATILFTSGSTGLAKAAISTHRAVTTGLYAYAIGLLVLTGILESEGRGPVNPPRTLVNVPLFHVTGEVPVLLNSFVIGRTMVLMEKWDAGEALRLIQDEKITYFVGVPTMSLELMQHPDRGKYDLSSLTDIAAGGAARPVAHVTRLRESFPGAQPALGYGLTETNAAGCGNFWQNYADKPDSTGRPQRPIVEIAILGKHDRHLADGVRGEIAIRSASNIRAYWGDPEATRAVFTADHFLRTGDIGYLDDDKYLFIVDRKKDIIIRGGENISAQEVEAAIYAHPGVREACVFAVPDERLGEVPAAAVYGEADPALDAESLRAFLAGHIAHFKIPAYFWMAGDPLPKLGTGKIDKIAVREQYRGQIARAA